jgi:hypothetical protein
VLPKDVETFHYRKKRTAVMRALSFIEAHRLAEKRLVSYFDSFASISADEGFTTAAFRSATEIVLDESAKQVAEAQKILDRIPGEQVNSMIAHYACSILLHRLATFVERNSSDGILTKKEAKVFLKRIDRSVQATRTCNCNADPPTPQEVERALQSVEDSTTKVKRYECQELEEDPNAFEKSKSTCTFTRSLDDIDIDTGSS